MTIKEQIKSTGQATPEELYSVGFNDGLSAVPDLGLCHLADYKRGFSEGKRLYLPSDYCVS